MAISEIFLGVEHPAYKQFGYVSYNVLYCNKTVTTAGESYSWGDTEDWSGLTLSAAFHYYF